MVLSWRLHAALLYHTEVRTQKCGAGVGTPVLLAPDASLLFLHSRSPREPRLLLYVLSEGLRVGPSCHMIRAIMQSAQCCSVLIARTWKGNLERCSMHFRTRSSWRSSSSS